MALGKTKHRIRPAGASAGRNFQVVCSCHLVDYEFQIHYEFQNGRVPPMGLGISSFWHLPEASFLRADPFQSATFRQLGCCPLDGACRFLHLIRHFGQSHLWTVPQQGQKDEQLSYKRSASPFLCP